MSNKIYGAIALIGGTAGALDKIDGADLADKDIALVVVQDSGVYHYILDVDSGAAESSPNIIAPDTNPGDKRWILHKIFSVTGISGLLADDQHVLDSEVLAYLLALTGAAANLKIFIDAAGTGLGWANGIKRLSITRDFAAASGDVSYTGVGFKPTAMIAFAMNEATAFTSYGIADLNSSSCLSDQGGIGFRGGSLIDVSATTGNGQYAIVKSMDSDGFTLTWTKVGSPTGTLRAELLIFR